MSSPPLTARLCRSRPERPAAARRQGQRHRRGHRRAPLLFLRRSVRACRDVRNLQACDATGAGISLVSAVNQEQLAWNIQSAVVDGFIVFCLEGGSRLVELTRERNCPSSRWISASTTRRSPRSVSTTSQARDWRRGISPSSDIAASPCWLCLSARPAPARSRGTGRGSDLFGNARPPARLFRRACRIRHRYRKCADLRDLNDEAARAGLDHSSPPPNHRQRSSPCPTGSRCSACLAERARARSTRLSIVGFDGVPEGGFRPDAHHHRPAWSRWAAGRPGDPRVRRSRAAPDDAGRACGERIDGGSRWLVQVLNVGAALICRCQQCRLSDQLCNAADCRSIDAVALLVVLTGREDAGRQMRGSANLWRLFHRPPLQPHRGPHALAPLQHRQPFAMVRVDRMRHRFEAEEAGIGGGRVDDEHVEQRRCPHGKGNPVFRLNDRPRFRPIRRSHC